MIKLNICAARVPRMTHAEYSRYMKDTHARLVMGSRAMSGLIRAYIQQHVFDAAYGSLATLTRYDSVSHIMADTVEDHLAATRTRDYQEVIAPDEPNFADGRTAVFTMLEESALALPVAGASPHRLLYYGVCKPGIDRVELQESWIDAHAQVVASTPGVVGSVRHAVLNRVKPMPDAQPAFDAMGELGFLERSDVPAMRDYVAMMEERLASLLDTDRGFLLLADAVLVRGSL